MDLITELVEVRRSILSMSAIVEQQVDRALNALETMDIALARLVKAGDEEINNLELEIENECLRIFALTHPVASDLRFVMAVLRINSNLERIGDKAKSIAKRIIDLADCAPLRTPPALLEMAQRTKAMLSDALTALANEDADLGRRVRISDDSVDALHREVFNWAHTEIPTHVESTHAVIDVLSIGRALERIADLAAAIAEDVIFLVDGAIVRHKPPD
jgi:phosphate transport system protein